jgi:predicted RNase H-like HicB family nuclease
VFDLWTPTALVEQRSNTTGWWDFGRLLDRRGRSMNGTETTPRVPSASMSESLRLTIVYEQGEDGWIVASVPEVPGAHSQGKTREEARANVIDALRGILELRFGDHPTVVGVDSEPLELVIAG